MEHKKYQTGGPWGFQATVMDAEIHQEEGPWQVWEEPKPEEELENHHRWRPDYLQQLSDSACKGDISNQKQQGWSGVTSDAQVKCSVHCFQSNAFALPRSHCEYSLTDVAYIEWDADGFVFFFFPKPCAAARCEWLKKVSSASDKKTCCRFRSCCIALTVWALFFSFKHFKQTQKENGHFF